ncbi:MAG: hypothetical protein ABI699_13160 [Caldimonas sp.]
MTRHGGPRRCGATTRRIAGALLATWLGAAAGPAPAADAASAPAAASAAGAASASVAASAPGAAGRASLERIRALRSQRPGDGLLAYYQAIVHAGLGERDAALAELKSLVGRRLGIVPAAGVGLDPLWADPEFQALRSRLADDEPRTPDAPVAFRLGDAGLIPEGIVFDPARRRFFIGSIARHKIVVRDRRGRVRDFSRPDDRLDTVLGLAIDPRRRQLLAVSTNGFEDSARTGRRNALFRYDLRSGRLAARLDVADALQLNDVAVAPDGTLYVTDSAAGSLYRMRRGEPGLTLFGTPRSFPGANGVAVAPDGTVYVTLSTGVARVDPAAATSQRLAQPDSVVSGGIDGLYWHDGDLVGVQNSTNPGRVIRLKLGDGGRRIDGLTVLQSHHHPAFDEPTTGTITGGALHVLANTYVGHYQPDGTLRDGGALAPTQVLAVPLRR